MNEMPARQTLIYLTFFVAVTVIGKCVEIVQAFSTLMSFY